MAASSTPTVAQLASTLGVMEAQIQAIADSLGQLEQSRAAENERTWTALGSLAGLEGVAHGMAEIAELLGPLRQLVPPTTATQLAPGVGSVIRGIRAALGGNRETNFVQLTTDWDGPVPYIGEPDPEADDRHDHDITFKEETS